MTSVKAGFAAGAAAVTITPDRWLEIQGYNQGPATGTLDSLEARAVAFDDGQTRAAIVSADLIGLNLRSVQRIRSIVQNSCGIPGDHVMVACSHNHSGPVVMDLGALDQDSNYQPWLEQALGDVVSEASRNMRPARLGVGEGLVDININRRRRTVDGTLMQPNPQGVVDKRVRVLRVDEAGAPEPPGTLGEHALPQADPIALLFSYACHATALGRENRRYSGDYPGAAVRTVERFYDAGTRAVFLPGCFGNIRPNLVGPENGFRTATDHEVVVLGRLLGSEVVQTAEQIVAESIVEIAVARREINLPFASIAEETELRAALSGARAADTAWAESLLDRLERGETLPDSDPAEVQVMRLGRHWIVSTPGETMLEIGQSIERGLADLALAQPNRGDLTLALGYTNGNVGYLCPPSAMFEGGYEPATSFPVYLRPGPFTPAVEATLVGTALDLARKLEQTHVPVHV